MKTFTLVVEEHRAPWRRLRLVAPGSTTLAELAGVLVGELGLELGRVASFFRSGKAWDGRTEYSSHGRSEHALQGVRLERLALRPGSTLLYLHDVDHPRWHGVGVTAVAEGEELLRVVECVVPPSPADVSLASRLFEALEIQAADASAEVERAQLADGHRLAGELLERGKQVIERLAPDLGLDVERWLLDLPFELAHAGLVDEAVALAARGAEVLDSLDLRADRALILARAGRRAEAEAVVAEVLASPSAGAVQLARCGDALRALGDLARAEAFYRQAIPLVGGRRERELVRERLVDLLVAQGRRAEVRALELLLEDSGSDEAGAADAQSDPAFDRAVDTTFDIDELVPAPRVGRNDPCPCGSGKKFKKCCARGAGTVERSEFEFLSSGLHRALEHLLPSDLGASLKTELARFAGPAYEGLELNEALPLLPEEQAELAYLDWWLVDREERAGATLLDRYLEKRASKLDPREARVLARLRASVLGLYRLEALDPAHPKRKPRIHDLLAGGSREIPREEVLVRGSAEHLLLRLVEADGVVRFVHAGIPVQPEHVERIVAGVRPRWGDLPRAERAPLLFQAWLDALHTAPVG